MLVIALALPACVLSEDYAAIGDGEAATTGAADPTPGAPDSGSTESTSAATRAATTAMPGDSGDSDTGPLRDEGATTTGTDEDTTGRPEDRPDVGSSTSGDTTTSGPMVLSEDCCVPSEAVGCGNPGVEACVCEYDPYCCEKAWDDVCVDLMVDVGCLACDRRPMFGLENCCVATGEPGCPEDEVAACVCAEDPYCCDVAWDDVCVGLVEEHACGSCEQPPLPACCEPSAEPGCPADTEIETCVCATDSFCCASEWDNVCVNEVQTLSCGECGWTSDDPDCCVASGTPGCDDPEIEACVCGGDAFCCQSSWDDVCVENVEAYNCGSCPTEPETGTGSGETGGSDGGSDGETGGSDTGGATASYGSTGTG